MWSCDYHVVLSTKASGSGHVCLDNSVVIKTKKAGWGNASEDSVLRQKWLHVPINPTLGRWDQEDQESEANVGCIRPSLQNKKAQDIPGLGICLAQ